MAGDSFRRAVRAPDWRAQPEAIHGVDDTEAGGAGFVWRNEDVTRMKGAVTDTGRAREVDRGRELGDERQHLVQRRRCVVPHRDVEGLGSNVFFSAVGNGAFETRGYGFDDRGVKEACISGLAQLVSQRSRLLGSDVEAEDFDRYQPIARGLVCSKHGAKRADTDLMQHPEGAKRRGRRKSGRIVSGQLACSSV